jgi:hypothetical protein
MGLASGRWLDSHPKNCALFSGQLCHLTNPSASHHTNHMEHEHMATIPAANPAHLAQLAQTLTLQHQSRRALRTTPPRHQGTALEAKQVIQEAAHDAAVTLADIASDPRVEPKERIAASRDILDRAGVGKQVDMSAANAVPMQFLAMAMAGIAALAGRDVSAFGDMTDLQEKIQTLKVNEYEIQDEDAEDAAEDTEHA